MGKRKYFKKLFIIYIIVTLVYALFISSFFVYQNNKILDLNFKNTGATYVKNYIGSIDTRLESIKSYSEGLGLDETFRNYINKGKNYYYITMLHGKLKRDMMIFSDLNVEYGVTRLEDNLLVTSTNTRDIALYARENGLDHFSQESLLDYFNEKQDKQNIKIILNNTQDRLYFVEKKKTSYNKWIFILYSIDLEAIKPSNEQELLYLQWHDKVFSIDHKSETSFAIQMLSTDKEHLKINHEMWYKEPSNVYEGLYYIYKMPYDITELVKKQYELAVLLYMGLSIGGVIVAFILTKRIYRPIDKIMNLLDTKEDNSTLDEFDFLNKTTLEIKEANNTLNQIIQNNKIDLRTKFIRDLIHGLYHKDLQLKIEKFGLSYLAKNPRIILIQIHPNTHLDENYLSEDTHVIRQSIYTIIYKKLSSIEGLNFNLCEINHKTYGLLLANETVDQVKILLNKLLAAVKIEIEVYIAIAIGDQVRTLDHISYSYQSAKNILENRFTFDKRAVLSSEDLESKFEQVYYYPIDLEKEIINYTLFGKNEKLESIFKQLYEVNFTTNHLEYSEKRNFLIALVATLKRIHQKINTEDYQDDDTLKEVFETKTLSFEEIFNRIRVIFLNYADICFEKHENKDDEYTRGMLRYIEQHFNEDISLEDVAAYLNVSAGYFCTIFKKNIGENFKGYLNKYRVEQAKRILSENPNIKIKDLTTMVV